MSGDLDHILRDLEKQVHDFSLTVENPTAIHTQPYPNLASSRVNHSTRQAVDGAHPSSSKFQHSVPRHDTSYSVHDPANIYSSDISSDGEPDPRTQRPAQQHLADDTESSDDDICIADLQRPMKMQMDRMASKKSHLPTTMTDHSGGGLVRSPSVNVRSIKPDIPDEPTPVAPSQDTDDDLRAAMQRAWAVLEAESGVTEELNQKSDTSIKEAEMSAIETARSEPLPRIAVQTITIRIYIDDAKNHKTVQLTNLLTAAMVIQYLKKKALIDASDEWTLFEIANSHGVERPIRSWEIVLDVISAWESDAANALLVKKYAYHTSLTAEAILHKRTSAAHGWVYIEYKKGKWQKRFCFIKDNAIYHAKDNKGSSSAILCYLATFDVYTLLQPLHAAPAPFVFALRAQEKFSMFEREHDYLRLLAVDDQEAMKEWVLSIRAAKSAIHYQYHPRRVMNPLAPIYGAPATQGASDDAKRSRWGNSNREHRSEHSGDETVAPLMKSMSLRRKKSTRDFNASGSVAEELGRNYPLNSGTNSSHHRSDTIRRDDDKRPVRSGTIRGLSRSGTLRGKDSETSEGPLIDCSEPVPFAKGSLLAKEDLESAHTHTHYRQAEDNSHHGPTLINIDDKVKFSKGSLLEKNSASTAAPVPNGFKISRSKSTREYHHRDHGSSSSGMEPAGEHRRHMSLRRKPTNKDRDRARHHDVPLPSTATPSSATSMTASSSTSTMSANKTLLRLDDTPEQSHTRTLLERQMKPLLNFAETDEKARRS